MDFDPSAIFFPGSEIGINGLPRRKVMGHRSPPTAFCDEVENRIENRPKVSRARTTSRFCFRTEGFD